MIKLFFFLRRAAHLSHEEFLAYWSGPHAELSVRHATDLKVRRYIQNYQYDTPVLPLMAAGRNCLLGDFDGLVETWFDSIEDILEVGETAGEIAGKFFEDEQRFLDVPQCVLWIATERQFVPPA